MLRTRLLTATAAIALFGAGAAIAHDTPDQTAPAASAPASATQTTSPAPAQTAPAATPAPAASPTAAAAGQETPAVTNSVVDVLRAQGQFTTLLSALDAAQLTDTLRSQPAISIFAPTDAAFAALPEAERTRLMDPANANELRQLLLYHVVVADVSSDQIEGARGGVETAARTQVQLDGTGDAIKVDNATVTTADIDAGNGAVFIIDRVLNPAESQVATGDAEEAAPAATTTEDATAADEAPVAAPPVDEDADDMTPPADDAMTDDATDAGMDDGDVAPPPSTPSTSSTRSTTMSAPAPAAAPATTMSTPTTAPSTTPTAPSATTAPTAPTTTTRPAAGVNAPNGQPAATVTTTASPTVPNPTDGQQDDEDADEADTTAPTPQS